MFSSGGDIKRCKSFNGWCNTCNGNRKINLYQKSTLAGGTKLATTYHTMCDSCKAISDISEKDRKAIYKTFKERFFSRSIEAE
ncbi:MAG: hypothetical protein CL547_03465 [Alcanivorax sp.]|nr:hypothetical protein [Alcanivorax sp.]|tara:strand:+ start:254 stop:502 length:249 start_codon:yes stop_codon:yes gene_type:complete